MAVKRPELTEYKLSTIKLPDNSTYDVKDYFASHFKGETSTNIAPTFSDVYTLVTTEPDPFNPTNYYKKVDNDYVQGTDGEEWAENTWYTRTQNVRTLKTTNPITLTPPGGSTASTMMSLGDMVLYGNDLFIATEETDDATNNVKWLPIASSTDTNTTYTLSGNGTTGDLELAYNNGSANGTLTLTPSSGAAQTVDVTGLGTAAFLNATSTYSSTGTDPVTGAAVAQAIQGITSAMVFKGAMTVTVDGTDTTKLIFTVADEEIKTGYVYKVTSATLTTYTGSDKIQVGDTVIAVDDVTATGSAGSYSVEYDSSDWTIIPSGDDVDVKAISIAEHEGLVVSDTTTSSTTTITTSGTIALDLVESSGNPLKNTGNASNTTDVTTTAKIYPVILDKNNKLAVGVPWENDNTTYQADAGITLDTTTTPGTFKHANTAITPVGTEAIKKIKFDAYGHITGYVDPQTVTASSVSAEAASASPDTNAIAYYSVSGETLTLNNIVAAPVQNIVTTATAT